MSEWQPIETAPKDGTEVKLRREDCPGYDCKAKWVDGQWQLPWFFIRGDMTMHNEPTHWQPVA